MPDDKKLMDLVKATLAESANDEEHSLICGVCKEAFVLKFGSESTNLCNDCAHDLAFKFAEALQRVNSMIEANYMKEWEDQLKLDEPIKRLLTDS